MRCSACTLRRTMIVFRRIEGATTGAGRAGSGEMSQWGEFQGRIEDNRLVRGHGLYVGDIALAGMAFAVVVRSDVAAARIRRIETGPARQLPGVLAVYTGADLAADGIPDFPCKVE